MASDVVEAVARAIATGQLAKWDAAHIGETPGGEEPDDMREGFRDDARAAIEAVFAWLKKPGQQARDAGWHVQGPDDFNPEWCWTAMLAHLKQEALGE